MKKKLITAACVLFWLALWQAGAMLLRQEILLVSPVQAVRRLFELAVTADFLKSVGFSAGRIMAGFGLGLAGGTILAVLAGKIRFVRTLLSPLVSAVKAVPVASITVLALVWVSSRNLSTLVSLLISLPIVYSNMLEGIESLDPKLREMAEVFRVPALRRAAGVYLPQLLPYFRAAVRLAVGLSWKSGAAAEIIGIPSGSIGEKLYQAKIYLETADLFAWTIAVILLSWLSEKLLLLLVNAAAGAVSALVGRRGAPAGTFRPAGITVRGLTRRYGENTVLDGFSCEIPPGELIAVAGASGCGKTTLLSLLTGLLAPDGGEVLTDPPGARFSAVFQEDRLCENLTVSANIRLVNSGLTDAEISGALDSVGLSGCEKRPVRELSGGMKRRTALVRALLSEYGAIVLDEPFKGLDEATKKQVLDYCREKLRGKTAVLVTHDISEAEELCACRVIRLSINL